MFKVFLLLAITLASAAAFASASSGDLCTGQLTSQLDNYASAQQALAMANKQENMVQGCVGCSVCLPTAQ